jgi:hypothetical protein
MICKGNDEVIRHMVVSRKMHLDLTHGLLAPAV